MFKNENKGSINTFKLEMKKKTAKFEEEEIRVFIASAMSHQLLWA